MMQTTEPKYEIKCTNNVMLQEYDPNQQSHKEVQPLARFTFSSTPMTKQIKFKKKMECLMFANNTTLLLPFIKNENIDTKLGHNLLTATQILNRL